MEIKPIPGWPGYFASAEGGIWSDKSGELRKLQSWPDRKGYLIVQLWREGKPRGHKVHRLVWSAFNGPIPEGMHIAHDDGIRDNNRLKNLKCCTPLENDFDKIRHGTSNRKLNAEKVRVIRGIVAWGWPIKRVARWFGVSRRAIRDVIKGRTWKHVV